jgi:hypothetical protein
LRISVDDSIVRAPISNAAEKEKQQAGSLLFSSFYLSITQNPLD